jgi:ribosome assembly protein 4
VRTLEGHGHWVNHLALSTDFVLRTGPFDHTDPSFATREQMHQAAVIRYNATVEAQGDEMLASASDDFTIFLWSSTSKKPVLMINSG